MSNWTTDTISCNYNLPCYEYTDYTTYTITYTPRKIPRQPKQYKKQGVPRRWIIFPYTPPRKQFPRYLKSQTNYKRGKQ